MDFVEVELADVCIRLSSGKNIKAKDIFESGIYPVYGGNGLRGYTSSKNFSGDCAIIGRQGAYCGNVRYFSGDAYMTEHAVVVQADENNNTRYFAYLLSKMNLGRLSGQSAQPGLSVKTLGQQIIKLPNKEAQDKIAGILTDIESKIEINNAINKNLEEQAQALFKAWFVDFEPFGGEMPSDWKEQTLGDVCGKITDGSHYSPKEDANGPYPMYSVKDMEAYGFNSKSCKHISKDDFDKMIRNDCVPKVNDILVAKDGSYLKEIFICNEAKDEAVLSSIAIFRPDTNKIYPSILLYLLKQPSVRKDVGDNYVSGSALPRIVLKDFKKYRFVLPPIEIQSKVDAYLSEIISKINININENLYLDLLRDTLIPKLMSGELDVTEIDI